MTFRLDHHILAAHELRQLDLLRSGALDLLGKLKCDFRAVIKMYGHRAIVRHLYLPMLCVTLRNATKSTTRCHERSGLQHPQARVAHEICDHNRIACDARIYNPRLNL